MALFVSSLMAVHIHTVLWRRNFRVSFNVSLSKYRLTVWNSLFLFIHEQLIWGLSPSLGFARHKAAVRHSNTQLWHIGCVKIHISRECLDSRHHHHVLVNLLITQLNTQQVPRPLFLHVIRLGSEKPVTFIINNSIKAHEYLFYWVTLSLSH